jgi:hypothetical protein
MARLQSEIPLLRWKGGVFTVNRAGVKDRGPRRQVDLCHVPKVNREPIRSFHDLLRQSHLLLILYGWSWISMASLAVRSMHLVFVARMGHL